MISLVLFPSFFIVTIFFQFPVLGIEPRAMHTRQLVYFWVQSPALHILPLPLFLLMPAHPSWEQWIYIAYIFLKITLQNINSSIIINPVMMQHLWWFATTQWFPSVAISELPMDLKNYCHLLPSALIWWTDAGDLTVFPSPVLSSDGRIQGIWLSVSHPQCSHLMDGYRDS